VTVLASVEGTIDFGGGGLTADANADLALATFDVGGAHQWSQLFTGQFGSFSIFNTGMDVNSSGSIVITGEFTGSTSFGGGTLVSNGLDVFVARFDGAGFHDYSAKFGGAGDQTGTVAWFDPEFNMMLAGTFAGDLDFGGGTLANAGARDLYVASIAGNGTLRFANSFGSASSESSPEGAAGPNGELIFSVRAFADIDFGGGLLTQSFFLAKLDGEVETETATPLVAPAGSAQDLRVYPNPFRDATSIRWAAPAGAADGARVRIFDAAGRVVRVLEGPAGASDTRVLSWDGRTTGGDPVVPGVYFVRAEAAPASLVQRVVRIR